MLQEMLETYTNVWRLSPWIMEKIKSYDKPTDSEFQEKCGDPCTFDYGRQEEDNMSVSKKGVKRPLEQDDDVSRNKRESIASSVPPHQFYGLSQDQCRLSCNAFNQGRLLLH